MQRTYLVPLDIPIAHPFAELGPPVLEHIGLRVLDALPVAEAAHGPGAGQHVDAVQVYLQPLGRLVRDLVLGAPGAAADLRVQSVLDSGGVFIQSSLTYLRQWHFFYASLIIKV